MDLSSQEVLVTAMAPFRGQPWEGRGGHVTPGDTFSTPRLRAVELKANGLVRDADLPGVKGPVGVLPEASRVSVTTTRSKEKAR